MGSKPVGQKFVPVHAEPVPCSVEELDLHLRLFVDAFVAPGDRDRWHHLFVEKRRDLSTQKSREKASRLISDFVGRKEYVRFLRGVDASPLTLASRFGDGLCVCFDLCGGPYKLSMADAVSRATQEFRDVIISSVAGKSAVVVDHEGGVRLCENP
jgi:hypothetical protein